MKVTVRPKTMSSAVSVLLMHRNCPGGINTVVCIICILDCVVLYEVGLLLWASLCRLFKRRSSRSLLSLDDSQFELLLLFDVFVTFKYLMIFFHLKTLINPDVNYMLFGLLKVCLYNLLEKFDFFQKYIEMYIFW